MAPSISLYLPSDLKSIEFKQRLQSKIPAGGKSGQHGDLKLARIYEEENFIRLSIEHDKEWVYMELAWGPDIPIQVGMRVEPFVVTLFFSDERHRDLALKVSAIIFPEDVIRYNLERVLENLEGVRRLKKPDLREFLERRRAELQMMLENVGKYAKQALLNEHNPNF